MKDGCILCEISKVFHTQLDNNDDESLWEQVEVQEINALNENDQIDDDDDDNYLVSNDVRAKFC